MASKPLLEFTSRGIYCSRADVYIDPWLPVKKAIITHAHADHAHPGHQYYLSTHTSREMLKLRLGNDIHLETKEYNQSWKINNVVFSLHPAGHILGSAQVRVAYKGEVWVASGDYKLENDGVSEPFEIIKCHTFITESTFGLPIFKWKSQKETFEDINHWWASNQQRGLVSILGVYSLGKAQRVLQHLDHQIGKVFVHGAIANANEAVERNGTKLSLYSRITPDTDKSAYKNSLILVPPSALNSTWTKIFGRFDSAIASGWMSLRGAKKRKALDRGFVLSDHADWQGLNQAIRATGADQIFVTHGYTAALSRWLNESGIASKEIPTKHDEGNVGLAN